MDLTTFEQLLAPEGQALLARAAAQPDLRDETILRHLTALRREAAPDLATAVVETLLLRRRAAVKFERAVAMYFIREALEQASAEVVARYRARRFAGHPAVSDLGCGIGGDTIALAGVVPTVMAVDRDPLRLAMARANVRAYGVEERVRLLDADLHETKPPAAAAFFDPARRTKDGRRVFSITGYEPPLSLVGTWLPVCPAVGVKISPGVDTRELAALGLDAEVEFISVAGELREAALWFGPLRDAASDGRHAARRATLLPEGHTLTDAGAPPAAVMPPGRFLLEPDAAIYRAGLLAELAGMLSAWQIDRDIAYLSTDAAPHTPFARAWPVEDVLPFSVKGVRRRLRELRVGVVVVKKRGSPLDPQEFERMLRLDGPERRTVVLTRAAGRPVAIICGDPLPSATRVSPHDSGRCPAE